MIRFSYSNEDTKDEEERKESGWRDERYLRCQAPSAEPRGVWPCLRDRATTPGTVGSFPGAKMFPGTILAFLGTSDPFLGIQKAIPGT